MQGLQLDQNIFCEGVDDLVWRRAQLETSATVLIGRESRRDVQQVFVPQSDEGAAHEGAECEGIKRVCNSGAELTKQSLGALTSKNGNCNARSPSR